MVWIHAGQREVDAFLRLAPKPLYVTAEVGPASTILSLPAEGMETLLQFLTESGLRHTQIPSEFGFHSPLVDCWKTEFIQSLDDLCVGSPGVPVYSSVIGGLIESGMFDTRHWWRVVRKKALFASAVRAVLADGYEFFLEIGPHPMLSNPILDTATILGKKVSLLASMRRDQPCDLVICQSLQSLRSAAEN
jgi:polyketide synthase 12